MSSPNQAAPGGCTCTYVWPIYAVLIVFTLVFRFSPLDLFLLYILHNLSHTKYK